MNRYERAVAAGATPLKLKFEEGFRFVGGLDIPDAESFAQQFNVSPDAVAVERGVCWSSDPDYSVNMRAIWLKDDKFWELESSHCSCNGYEDSWDPKEVSAAYIRQLVATKKNQGQSFDYGGSLLNKDFIIGLLWVVGDTDE